MDYESRQLPIRPDSFVGRMAVIFVESFKHLRQKTILAPTKEGEMVAISAKGEFNLPDHQNALSTQEICTKVEISLGAGALEGNITIYSSPQSDLPIEIPSL